MGRTQESQCIGRAGFSHSQFRASGETDRDGRLRPIPETEERQRFASTILLCAASTASADERLTGAANFCRVKARLSSEVESRKRGTMKTELRGMDKRWFRLWFWQKAIRRCEECGKSRTTLRSIVRHIAQKHTVRVNQMVR